MLTTYQNHYYLIVKNHQCVGVYTVSELAKSIINAYHLDINILNRYQDVTSLIQYIKTDPVKIIPTKHITQRGNVLSYQPCSALTPRDILAICVFQKQKEAQPRYNSFGEGQSMLKKVRNTYPITRKSSHSHKTYAYNSHKQKNFVQQNAWLSELDDIETTYGKIIKPASTKIQPKRNHIVKHHHRSCGWKETRRTQYKQKG
jgi:hypothetical protein